MTSVSSSSPVKPKNTLCLYLALLNSLSVIGVALVAMVVCGVFQLWVGVLVGIGVLISGGLEFLGRHLWMRSDLKARLFLVGSQLWLLLFIVFYCGIRLIKGPDMALIQGLVALVGPTYSEAGMDVDFLTSVIHSSFVTGYVLMIFFSVLYQGGLAWFYWMKTRALFPPGRSL